MPRKRRFAKRRQQYPAAVQALLDGQPIAMNETNRQALCGVYFFNDFPELGPDARARAGEIIRDWPAA